MEIGIRELKEHLSEYLERAARGETLTVTDRGRAKAVLGPLPGGDNIARGISEGWISPASRTGPKPAAPAGVTARMSIAEMIDEDRGDD